VGVSELCTAVRRSTVRLFNDGRVEFREDPLWFDAYMRREGIDFSDDSAVLVPVATPGRQEVN
jgi:hypothetical protein